MPLTASSSRPARLSIACTATLAAIVMAGRFDVRVRADATGQAPQSASQGIPRAEHPRPDFMRADWATLNGRWDFEFDELDAGLRERWFAGAHPFSKTIVNTPNPKTHHSIVAPALRRSGQ